MPRFIVRLLGGTTDMLLILTCDGKTPAALATASMKLVSRARNSCGEMGIFTTASRFFV
jgi:hypothetical protein